MFGNTVMKSRNGNDFRRWELGVFSSTRGKEVVISAATGLACESVRAAAWNLQNRRGASTERFLQNVLRSGVQAGAVPGGIRFHVPGATLHVNGYEEGISLKLEAVVDTPADARTALGLMVDHLCQATARGVYAQTQEEDTESEEEKDADEELESIQF